MIHLASEALQCQRIGLRLEELDGRSGEARGRMGFRHDVTSAANQHSLYGAKQILGEHRLVQPITDAGTNAFLHGLARPVARDDQARDTRQVECQAADDIKAGCIRQVEIDRGYIGVERLCDT
jgi:hypothetical protein